MPDLRSSYGFLPFCHLIRFFLAGAPKKLKKYLTSLKN